MIVGGYATSEYVTCKISTGRRFVCFSVPVQTEVWDLETGFNKMINPILPNYHFAYGIGLFAVDFNFCQK